MMKLKAKETFVNIGKSEFSGTAVQQLLKDLRRSWFAAVLDDPTTFRRMILIPFD